MTLKEFRNIINLSKNMENAKENSMHELGVLCHALRTVDGVAKKNRIRQVKQITLEVGTESTYVPYYLEKLFPVAAEQFPVAKGASLRLEMVPGRNLVIKELAY